MLHVSQTYFMFTPGPIALKVMQDNKKHLIFLIPSTEQATGIHVLTVKCVRLPFTLPGQN